jgi:hypothetical protein
MKALAILAGFALATPAAAQPYQPYRDYDRRTDESFNERYHNWIPLAGEVRVSGGAQSVRIQRHGIERLRIEATRGRPYIQQVRVQYRDGGVDAYPVDRWLDRPGETVDIDLRQRGRAIQRLVILTPGGHWGAYRVLAE